MKKAFFPVRCVLILTLLLLSFPLSSFKNKSGSEYDIVAIYKGINLNDGCKGITEDGVKSISVVLAPTKLEIRKYVVNITRKGADIYKVDDKDIYIETRYCYEYSNGQQVVLNVESDYGYSIGKITF